ncbi:hypothetical protein D1816_06050 [Aquimarina sp. AD10]|uniref:hypothetical protein n=1 Tax=Aquimarina sp. AD10 TaxID=1714849 RepID=UPI000E52CD88|nr:hypothetical protein [Aquimarina sp. AD10]AXT59930.1 hypothetical protein D1816_06050 [Aquimarina sp. AD10]RKM95649.1 hypothetical protein D7033_16560 [Aquimarina sp. AD10]
MIKKEYKLSLIKLGKFLLIFLIVDFGLGIVSKQLFFSQETGKYARSIQAVKNTNAQVLIFGSSHAHRHYVPEVFEKNLNKTTYNAGAEGQQLLYHLAMQQMIVKRVKPEVIILNIDEDFLYYSKEAYDRLSDLHPYYSDYRQELRPILGLESKLVDVKLFFNAYQTNSTIMHVLRYFASPQLDYLGYRPLFGKIEKHSSIINETNKEQDLDDNFVNALYQFIATAIDNDIKLVFVTSPRLNQVDDVNNVSFNKIKNIAKEKEIPLINYFNHKEFTNKLELFHDPSHLNDTGARLFSRDVALKIVK